jgi:septal ring factor EnvC (AmiA/AmiB activator)
MWVAFFLITGHFEHGAAESLSPVKLQKRIEIERRNLLQLRERLTSQKRRIDQSERKERSLLSGLEALDAQLEILQGEIRIQKYWLDLTRQRLLRAEQERKHVELKSQQAESRLRARIRSLYKELGVPHSLLALLNGGVFDAAQMREYVNRIAMADVRLIETVQKQRIAYHRIMEVIRSEEMALVNEAQRVEQEETLLLSVRKRKATLLASLRKHKNHQRQAYLEIRRAAKRLETLLKQWSSEGAKVQRQLFPERKGLLPWPVAGRIISRFDPIWDSGQSDLPLKMGITLTAKLGDRVQSVGDGKVMFADRLRGYGNLLVLSHGESFYSIYAHGTIPTVRVGEKVKEGQTIAWVGEGGLLGRPAIYFELRNRGKPVNPLRWLEVRVE